LFKSNIVTGIYRKRAVRVLAYKMKTAGRFIGHLQGTTGGGWRSVGGVGMYTGEQSEIRWARFRPSPRAILAASLWLVLLVVATPLTRAQDGASPPQGKGEDAVVARFESDKDQVALPLVSGRQLVFTDAVTINGKSIGYMLVDTGSNVTFLDAKHMDPLALKPYGEFLANDGRSVVRSYVADTFALGPLIIPRQLVGATDLKALQGFSKPIVGILGNDVMGKVPFTVDYAASSLVIHNPDRFKPSPDASAYDLPPTKPLGTFSKNPAAVMPTIEGLLDGRKIVFVIDTGFSGDVFLSQSVTAGNPKMLGKPVHPRKIPFSLFGQEKSYHRVRVDKLELSGKTLTNIRNTYTPDSALTPDQKVAQERFSSIGGGLLRNYRLTFDFRRKRVWVQLAPDVETLLQAGQLELASRDFAGLSPLAEFALCGDAKRFLAVLQAGAATDFVDDEGRTLLHMAVEGGSDEVLASLLKHKQCPDLNKVTSEAETPLMLTCILDEPGMAKRLIDAGADLNRQSRLGGTALTYAVATGSSEMVKLLIEKGANLTLATKEGLTPLSYAAWKGNEELFGTLLGAGSPLDQDVLNGRTMLHFAAYGGNGAIVQLVLKLKPKLNVDSTADQDVTPLMIAAEQGHKECVAALLKAGANPRMLTSPDENVGGKNALHFAALNGHEEVITVLLNHNHGTAIDAPTTNGLTALMLAAGRGHVRVVDVLLKAGADVNATDRDGMSVLSYAAKLGRPSVIPMLLQAGAKVSHAARIGTRPLDFAALQGDVDTARILVAAGADPKARGEHGRTAIDFAREAGHTRLVELLENGFRGVTEPAVPGK